MDGSLFVPEKIAGKIPGVLFLHGMTSSEKNYIPLAEEMVKMGFAALTVNLRGHGTSEGEFNTLTIGDGFKDALAAYDFLVSQEVVDKNRMGICGGSLGGALAVLVCRLRPVRSLVLRAPAVYTPEMVGMTYQKIMSDEGKIFYSIEDLSQTESIQAIEKFPGSLLVIQSEKDQIIPQFISQAYTDYAKSSKVKKLDTISDATHELFQPEWREKFKSLAYNWFKETL